MGVVVVVLLLVAEWFFLVVVGRLRSMLLLRGKGHAHGGEGI